MFYIVSVSDTKKGGGAVANTRSRKSEGHYRSVGYTEPENLDGDGERVSYWSS